MSDKVCTSRQAAAMVKDGAVLLCSGHMNMCLPEELCAAVERRWLEEGRPKALTLISGSGVGDVGAVGETHRGFEHFAHEGLVKRMIVGHNGSNHRIMRLQQESKIESYNLPYGVIEHALRARAEGMDVYLSPVGLGTFVDPRLEGGRTNPAAKEELVGRTVLKGKEYLVYDTPKIDVALIRGTTADEDGNLTCEDEAAVTDVLVSAMAARASGGMVFCQVKRVVPRGTLPASQVVVPGFLIDRLIVSEDPEEGHRMTQGEFYQPGFLGLGGPKTPPAGPAEPSARKIIARRAAMELRRGQIINLGVGIPELVADVAREEGVWDQLILTVDPGVIGGVPASRTSFGAAWGPSAVLDAPAMFDLYDSGFDAAFLGFAQCDEQGSVNASLIVDGAGREQRLGSGGFINLTHGAKCIIFCGTMAVKGDAGAGQPRKFVKRVRQVTFSGPQAAARGKKVLFVTECCVFRLTQQGLVLTEAADGISIRRDILPLMEFSPRIAEPVKRMEPSIFQAGAMGLRRYISGAEQA